MLAFIVVQASGCASSTSAPSVTDKPIITQSPGTPSQAKNTVSITNFSFSPQTITINKGESVTWTNLDSASHTVTGQGFDSGSLSNGQTFKFTFSTAGTFAYHCSFHADMTGTIIVK